MGEQPATASRGRGRRGAGELEAAVWAVLLAADTPLTASEVRERLGEEPALAYTTVVTTLVRLHAKAMATRTLAGRAHRYAPATTPAGMAARRMHQALADEPDHQAVLTRFLSDLSRHDEALLRGLLEGELDDGSGNPHGEASGPGSRRG